MPTYEFRCNKCRDTVEVFLKMSDKKPKTHKVDGGKLAQIYSPTPALYRGNGWAKKERG
jgi:putative FmdB family regulatory protein